jgi:hypothetical protein
MRYCLQSLREDSFEFVKIYKKSFAEFVLQDNLSAPGSFIAAALRELRPKETAYNHFARIRLNS